MITTIPCLLPPGTAFGRGMKRAFMDIILHVGAHRTGTTTFQHYICDNLDVLHQQRVGYWGPRRTRGGLFAGLYPGPAAAKGRDLHSRAEGRVQMHCETAASRGVQQLIVSDENMIGAPRDCIRRRGLYPSAGERMARVSAAFGDRVKRVVLSVRAQDLWWSSIAAYTVGRGHAVPGMASFDQIADNRRTWRDVITDLACAVPGAEITVVPFEQSAGRSDVLLAQMTKTPAPATRQIRWMNKSPDLASLRAKITERGDNAGLFPEGAGRWNPFLADQSAALREAYADDIMWLTAGADGLAKLTQNTTPTRAGTSLPPGDMTRGNTNDQGQLARSG